MNDADAKVEHPPYMIMTATEWIGSAVLTPAQEQRVREIVREEMTMRPIQPIALTGNAVTGCAPALPPNSIVYGKIG
jgi:hypothetical protein